MPFLLIVAAIGQQDTKGLLLHMAANEAQAKSQSVLYSYTSEERSLRTGGHLWRERVVETVDGPLRRLVSADGVPLSGAALDAEEQRLRQIEADPASFRKLNEEQKDNESHALQLLTMLPKAFFLTPAGERGACTAIRFDPDPAYEPATYEERVIHAMAGVVSIYAKEARLCTIDAEVSQPVVFGFGMLGRLDKGGKLSLERVNVAGPNWKTARIELKINGRILLLKTLTREQTTVRTNIEVLSTRPTLSQAITMTKPYSR